MTAGTDPSPERVFDRRTGLDSGRCEAWVVRRPDEEVVLKHARPGVGKIVRRHVRDDRDRLVDAGVAGESGEIQIAREPRVVRTDHQRHLTGLLDRASTADRRREPGRRDLARPGPVLGLEDPEHPGDVQQIHGVSAGRQRAGQPRGSGPTACRNRQWGDVHGEIAVSIGHLPLDDRWNRGVEIAVHHDANRDRPAGSEGVPDAESVDGDRRLREERRGGDEDEEERRKPAPRREEACPSCLMGCRGPVLHLSSSVALGPFAPIDRTGQGPFSRRSRILLGGDAAIDDDPQMPLYIVIIALAGGLSVLGALSILVSVRCRAVETHHQVLLEARRIQQQRLQRLHDRDFVGQA